MQKLSNYAQMCYMGANKLAIKMKKFLQKFIKKVKTRVYLVDTVLKL